MPRSTDAREKVLETAERLFRTQGFAATGLTQILEESGAPKGSYYHHFPGGKAQMAEEALAAYASRAEALIAFVAKRANGDREAFIRLLCSAFAKEMTASDWRLGCMVQNFAAELAPGDSAWEKRLQAIEQRWLAALASALRSAGIAPKRATIIAAAFLAALTGARTLARISQSPLPFDHVAETFVSAVRDTA